MAAVVLIEFASLKRRQAIPKFWALNLSGLGHGE